MIALIQRVAQCSVSVGSDSVSSIGAGLLILLGVHREDSEKDIQLLTRKCAGLRIFPDIEGKMNHSVAESSGDILVVSQFTLFGDVKKGLRPYFGDAAEPEKAQEYYQRFMAVLRESGLSVKGGKFGAHMCLEIINDGPVTIYINSRDL